MIERQFTEVGGVTKAGPSGRPAFPHPGTPPEANFIAHSVPMKQSAVVDMSNVSFIASLGVRMLIATAKALDTGGFRLALYGTNDNVMDILEHTDLIERVSVVDTEAEAVAAVTRRTA